MTSNINGTQGSPVQPGQNPATNSSAPPNPATASSIQSMQPQNTVTIDANVLAHLLAQVQGAQTQTNNQTLTFPNGDVYVGEVLNGNPHGKGTLTYVPNNPRTLNRYIGSFVNGQLSGGQLQLNNGTVYEGEFTNDLLNGRGRMYRPDGSSYEGMFYQGNFHGKGVYRYKDGSTYSGDFVNGKSHGRGVEKEVDGDIYDGEFMNDKKHGNGVLTSILKGYTYTGQFYEGSAHGQGKKVSNKTRETWTGVFNQGKFWTGLHELGGSRQEYLNGQPQAPKDCNVM